MTNAMQQTSELWRKIWKRGNTGDEAPAQTNRGPRFSGERSKTVNTNGLEADDLVIALMGPTGSGKSTFACLASGQERSMVGHALRSCTDQVIVTRFWDDASKRHVVLVDTPGFDDTYQSDVKVLEKISKWLVESYNDSKLLSGILYLHRITDNRMAGTSLKNLEVFQKLCGTDALDKVYLTTTMWDEVKPDVGEKRLDELREAYWKTMITQGAQIACCRNDDDSTKRLVRKIILAEKPRKNDIDSGTPSSHPPIITGPLQLLDAERQPQMIKERSETVGGPETAHIVPFEKSNDIIEVGERTSQPHTVTHPPHPLVAGQQPWTMENLSQTDTGPDVHEGALRPGNIQTVFSEISKESNVVQNGMPTSPQSPQDFWECLPESEQPPQTAKEPSETGIKPAVPEGALSPETPHIILSEESGKDNDVEGRKLTSHLHTMAGPPNSLNAGQRPQMTKDISETVKGLVVREGSLPPLPPETCQMTPLQLTKAGHSHVPDTGELTEMVRERKTVENVKGADVDDIIIVVLGSSGSGKSTFVRSASGCQALEVCYPPNTSELRFARFWDEMSGRYVVLVDTPGFEKSDGWMEAISEWLTKCYDKRNRLSGILICHRVTDNRVDRSTPKSKQLQKLFGKEIMDKVYLTATMWDQVNQRIGEKRLAELKTKSWKKMIDKGAQVAHCQSDDDSPQRLLRRIVMQESSGKVLLIQEEMVELNKQLKETAAGQQLYTQMEQLVERQTALLKRINKEMRSTADEEIIADLQREYDEVRVEIEGRLRQMDELKLAWLKRVVTRLRGRV